MSKKLATIITITESQQQLLKEPHRRSKMPIAEFIRVSVDLALEKNRERLPGRMDVFTAGIKPESETRSAPKGLS